MATTNLFYINEFAGTDANLKVTLADIATNTVQVTLDQVDPLSDIVGFFANFNGVSVPDNFTIDPSTFYLDDSGSTTDGVTDVHPKVNLNSQGVQRTYDLGVQIGKPGLKGGADDYQSVVFKLSAPGLDVSDFSKVGVHLQSVLVNGRRTGSSQLEGKVYPFQPFDILIAGTKYLDKTGNGITGDDEGLGGVTIFIDLNGDGVPSPGDRGTETFYHDPDNPDACEPFCYIEGSWKIEELGPEAVGKMVYEILPSGYLQTAGEAGYKLLPTSNGSIDIPGLDFANFKLFDISGTKYLDKTGDGITGDDDGLGGVTIYVEVDGISGPGDDDPKTITAADGSWSIEDLGPAALGKRVYEVVPDGYVQTVGPTNPLPSEGGRDISGLDFANKPDEDGVANTQGFWKQPRHFQYWPDPYVPGGDFSDIFGVAEFNFNSKAGGGTLLDALSARGGRLDALGRAATAAVLNAASEATGSGMNYYLDRDYLSSKVLAVLEPLDTDGNDHLGVGEIIDAVQDAWPNPTQVNLLASALDAMNNMPELKVENWVL